MEYTITKYLLRGKYEEVESQLTDISETAIRDLLLNIAFETESVSVYGFVQYMSSKTRDLRWTELAIEIMINPLCHIEGAYSVALFHSREISSNDRTIDNLERILFFYDLPEKLVEKEEAHNIAREIIKTDPTNEIAMKILYSTI